MPIPAGEIRRLREEERWRQAAHRRIRRERRGRALVWVIMEALLGTAILIGSRWISLYAASATRVKFMTVSDH